LASSFSAASARVVSTALGMFVGVMAALSTPAAAHAVLVASEPSAGARVDRAPQTITLTFDEPVETALGSLRVLDAAGALRSAGAVLHPSSDPRRIATRVLNIGRGRYVVAWQVVSADSHLVNGAYSFGVGVDAGPAPVAQAGTGAELLLPILHFGILAGALLGIGIPIGIAAFRLRSNESRYAAEFAGWCILAFAAFADVALRADLAGGTLPAALTTRVGELRLATIAAAVVGVFSLVTKRRNWDLTVVAAIASIASLSLAGHAGDGGVVGIAADALHVLAAATWIGLLAVGTTLEPSPRLRRISPVAASAVALIVATGIVATLRNAGSVQALLTTNYGFEIDLKIAGLILALAVALTARRALARGRFAIGGRLKLELWLLTAVIAVTAVLVESPLPRDAAPALERRTAFALDQTPVIVTAASSDPLHWTFRITGDGRTGTSPDGATITVRETVRNVGPIPVPLNRDASGTYIGTVTLPFAGTWSAFVSARRGEFDENHETFSLTEKRQ
jgi:copper transport protein